jgi:hypothetical protein
MGTRIDITKHATVVGDDKSRQRSAVKFDGKAFREAAVHKL